VGLSGFRWVLVGLSGFWYKEHFLFEMLL